MTTPINPDLLLKAAQMAMPDISWEISGGHVVDADSPPFYADRFNPLESDGDAWMLERALKNRENGEWQFGKTIFSDTKHKAFSPRAGSVYDDSDTLLLLKCICAMHSLPLYAPQ